MGITRRFLYYCKLVNRTDEEKQVWEEAKLENVERWKSSKNIKQLLKMLKSKNYKFREHAAESLDEIGWQPKDNEEKAWFFIASKDWAEVIKLGSSAIKPLVTVLKKDEYSLLRDDAAESLDEIGWQPKDNEEKALFFIVSKNWDEVIKLGSSAIKPLITVLEDEEEYDEIRESAALALAEIRAERAVKPLIALLKNKEDFTLHNSVAEALGKIGNRRAVKPLIDMFQKQDKYFSTSVAAAEALGEIRDKRALEPLITGMSYDYGILSEAATKALVKFGTHAVNSLIYSLKYQEMPNARRMAAKVLGKIGDPRAIWPLIESLKQEYAIGVYLFSIYELSEPAQALCEIGLPSGEALISLLKNQRDEKYFFARVEAIRVLGTIGDKRAVEPLIRSFNDEEFHFYRNYIQDALRNITGKDFGQDPVKWQDWWDKNMGNFIRSR